MKRQKPTPHPAIIMAPAAFLHRDVSVGGGGTNIHPAAVPGGLATTTTAIAIATATAGTDQLKAGALGGGGMGLADTETLLVRAPVRHVITQELQAYYDTVISLLAADNDGEGEEEEEEEAVVQVEGAGAAGGGRRVKKRKLQRKALIQSLSLDAGLQPLSPHLVAFFASEAANAAVRNPKHLCLILNAITAFVSNPFVELSHCLHDLLPTILTALLARRITSPLPPVAVADTTTNNNNVDMQWEVRDRAAAAAAAVCKRYPGDYANTAARIQKTLLSAMTDVHRPIETVCGAVKGLCLQGPRIVKMLVMPQLQALLERATKEQQQQQQQRDSGGGVSLSAGAVAVEKMKETLKEAAEGCVQWLQEEGVMKYKLVTAANKGGDGGDEDDGPQEEEVGGGGGRGRGRGKRGAGRGGRGRRGGREGRGRGRKRTSTDGDGDFDEEMGGASGGGKEVKEIDMNNGENYLENAWRDDFDVEVIIKVVETLFG